MSIDDLAHEAEVEAEVLRAVSGMTSARAERFLIALAFKIKGATPEAKPVVLGEDWRLVRGDPPSIESIRHPNRAVAEAIELADIPTRAPARTLGELSQRIVNFLERAGGTSTMGGIKDSCATSKWSRNRVGTEVFNLIRRGTIQLMEDLEGRSLLRLATMLPNLDEAPKAAEGQ
jgi:hypothetical protein